MAASSAVVVPPSLPRLLAALLVGGVGVVGGLLLLFGPGPVLVAVASAVGGLIVLVFVVAVVRQRPRVVITPEGFTVYKLFGEESRKWAEVHGKFAVIRIGWNRAVGYNLTAGHKARVGKKPTSLFAGYDAAVSGAFGLPAEELAELLNAHARQEGAGSLAGGAGNAGQQAEPS
jgi:hypothetical protein